MRLGLGALRTALSNASFGLHSAQPPAFGRLRAPPAAFRAPSAAPAVPCFGPSPAPLSRAYPPNSRPLSFLSKPPGMSGPARRAASSKPQGQPALQEEKPGSGSQGGPKDPNEYPRYSTDWWKEWAIIFTVFAVTGSSAVKFTRPAVNYIAGEGTFFGGPWTWRIAYLCLTFPIYTTILLTIGTLVGRGRYFRKVTKRMYGRILPANVTKMLD
ncbi:hypothetical protein DFJ74DRAFT_665727 [Hyaloraphidium curvatum]|nr:hypothetical protein DFJ74DRAFT_665727 [Hyaloraphidium curvatum]